MVLEPRGAYVNPVTYPWLTVAHRMDTVVSVTFLVTFHPRKSALKAAVSGNARFALGFWYDRQAPE